MLEQLASLSTTRTEICRIEKFAEEHELEEVQAALKDVKLNFQWGEKNVPIIKDAIKQIH